MKNKNVLVIGLGVSGIASVKALSKLGSNIFVYDDKTKEELKEKLITLKNYNIKYYFKNYDFDLRDIDFAIKSPGIKLNNPLIKRLQNENISVIGDVEAAYKYTNKKIVAITGTNGKTTTTTLIGELLKYSNIDCKVTGNIGSGILLDAVESDKDEILVAEVSSFQLESTETFKPYISVITNITPDHIDWHNGYENYIKSKFKVLKNQDKNDYCILNYDDSTLRKNVDKIKSDIIFFSAKSKLDEGIYINNNKIVYAKNKIINNIININEIFIPGKHNLENAMAAAAAAIVLNVPIKIINKVLKEFKGIEHRLEFVGEFRGIKYYNDSKGTNVESSVKAVEAIEKPIILIAGGYDKSSDFDDFISSFGSKVKHMILLGDTADKISLCAKKHGYNEFTKVKDMDEAVKLSFEIGSVGDNVVLSPACASWDMYTSYEVRGRDFKERVFNYGGAIHNE